LKLALVMIVRNEERDIARCLDSVLNYVDTAIIVDTGSTDRTMPIIQSMCQNRNLKLILESSTIGMKDGKIVNFAEARNYAISLVPADIDYIISLDADDEVVNADRLKDNLTADVVWYRIQNPAADHSFLSPRIWKNGLGIQYTGAAHEYLELPTNASQHTSDIIVTHHYGNAPNQEDGTTRNLRIMTESIDNGTATCRTYFYYSNQLREAQQYQQAIFYYTHYLKLSTWQDERTLAHAYRGRSARLSLDFELAVKFCWEGLAEDTRFNELWMELAYSLYELRRWHECIVICSIAEKNPIPTTTLFVERNLYTLQPKITKQYALKQLQSNPQDHSTDF